MGSRHLPWVRRLVSIAVLCLIDLWLAVEVRAQAVPALSGVVVDDAAAVLPGARVTVRAGDGRVIHATTTQADGTFAVDRLAPGRYIVGVEVPLFIAAVASVALPAPIDAPPLRIVLQPGGYSEDVVVTGRRVASQVADSPRKIEVVDATDLERTIAADLTDALKKNAGVDVIQYSGVLSGIGIRGFRPQFSGINKRSLLLIDGRPAGATNLGTVRLDGIDRIEVLRGRRRRPMARRRWAAW
jgi:outer membrane receptor protein involved in Fe transport